MKTVATIVAAIVAFSGIASAEVAVKLSDVHICCGACVRDINGAVKDLADTKITIDKDLGSVAIVAKDEAAAQKTVDAIIAAGYHGKSDNTKIKVKDDSGATDGNVKRLVVSGVHNCCGGCTNAIKEAINETTGVTGTTVKPKAPSFVVEGNFSPTALVKNLNAAGFHVKVAAEGK